MAKRPLQPQPEPVPQQSTTNQSPVAAEKRSAPELDVQPSKKAKSGDAEGSLPQIAQRTADLRERMKAIADKASSIASPTLISRIDELSTTVTALDHKAKQRDGVEIGSLNVDESDEEEEEEAMQDDKHEDGLDLSESKAILGACLADSLAPFRKVVYIMRGPVGAGKSTAARVLLARHLKFQGVNWSPNSSAAFTPLCRSFVLSTDDYFTAVDDKGVADYKFSRSKLREYHPKNQERCRILMELGITPLFIDNTNIFLWEMRKYVEIAESMGYSVQIIGPEVLGDETLDQEALVQRTQDGAEGRAPGKHVSPGQIGNMCRNFKHVSASVSSALDEIRRAPSPPRKDRPPTPRYAGLDVESKALVALGGIRLGPYFWNRSTDSKVDETRSPSSFMDARCEEDSDWISPDRLHVTVKYFGEGHLSQKTKAAFDALVDTRHTVEVRSLVFVRGGGLLCADVVVKSKVYNALAAAAGDHWVPHITLLNSNQWKAKESSDLLVACRRASEIEGPSSVRKAHDSESSDNESQNDAEEECFIIDVGRPETPDADDDAALKASLSSALGVKDQPKDGSKDKFPFKDRRVSCYRDVRVGDRVVDICALPLEPPLLLENCKFKMFT